MDARAGGRAGENHERKGLGTTDRGNAFRFYKITELLRRKSKKKIWGWSSCSRGLAVSAIRPHDHFTGSWRSRPAFGFIARRDLPRFQFTI